MTEQKPKVSCRLWVIMMCQQRLINCNKRLLWWDVGMREAHVFGGAEDI